MRAFLFSFSTAIAALCLLDAVLSQSSHYNWNGPGVTPEPVMDNVCLTNEASCGCCLMQRQMSRMEAFFNLSISELQKELDTAQAALNKVRSSRSAFSVALNDTRRCLGPFREDSTIKYQSVFLNLGDGYSTTTGVFTVPRSGVYVLALTIYSDAGSPGALLAACARLRNNGRLLATASENNTQDQEDSSSHVLAVQLQAGDKVDMQLPAGCYLCDDRSHYNTFTGFMLYSTD
ncbi:cerebellin 20 [Denticeps clupeoides]|uniref:cerebellin 20 n=1 Tax=Denticeps clupeoides TaxID=299321 RepID=UPI0010A4033C|nr:complement C1q-like protein 4 [Denticeps clupeoides]